MTKKINLLLFLSSLGLYAEYQIPQENQLPQEQQQAYPQYSGNTVGSPSQDPQNSNVVVMQENVEVDEEYLLAEDYLKFYNNRKKINSVINKDREIQETFNEIKNLKIANFTKQLKMNDINEILMHPSYPQTILLPKSATITNAYAYPPTVQPNFQYNRIDVIPNNALLRSNLVVTYLEGDQIKSSTFLITKTPNNRHSIIYPIIAYSYPAILNTNDVIQRYYEAYKKMPTHRSMININNTIYTFFKDNINGNIKIGETNFIMKVDSK
ncbi:MAG: hypothetical protein M0R46_09930 [Candidatus Muirbacterium halophilum]|nr:hypothetical protein [Candidatus Muirbacterium halophilum]